MQRRTLLRMLAGTSLAGLAGCGDGAGDGPATEPTPTATPMSTPTSTSTESTPTETPTPTPVQLDTDHVVDVGPGSLRFEPATLEISVGDSVGWIWRSSGHNVVVDSSPDDSSWSGTEGGPGTTYSEGHIHRHTFEVAGTYDYFCAPHRSAGMVGAVTVTE